MIFHQKINICTACFENMFENFEIGFNRNGFIVPSTHLR